MHLLFLAWETGSRLSEENGKEMERVKSESTRGANKFPTIAQLVERPTVVEKSQPSDGPWFESGLSDLFYWPWPAAASLSCNLKLGDLSEVSIAITAATGSANQSIPVPK